MKSQLQDRLQILHLEDNPLDAELIRETLMNQGILANIISVDTERDFRRILNNGQVDLILSDYSLPGFGGVRALEIVRRISPDLPFIFVSGTIGEDIAIESLKNGATDYVLKHRLQRLALSVRRALREVEERKRRAHADDALRESEERYRVLFDNTPLPMWVYDLATLKFLAVNEAAVQHYGFSRKEFLGMTIEEIRPAEALPALLNYIAVADDPSTSKHGEWTHRKKNGVIIEVEITSHRINFLGRRAEIVLAQDVTARKQAEEKLRLQSAALEAAANAIVITDASGKIIWVNSAFIEMSGYSASEAIGNTPRLLKSGKQPPGFYREMWETIQAGEVWHGAVTNRRKDGSYIQEDLTITPILNEEKEITHFIGIKQDITKHKLTEEALRGSELRYRRLFESAKDGILILEADSGRIIDANPYFLEMLGFSKEDLVDKELWQIGTFKDIVSSKLAFEELQQQGFIRYEDLPLQNRLGDLRQVEFVSNTYQAGDTRVIQCNIRDITERRVAEEELRRMNQQLQETLTKLRTKTDELASMTQQLWQASKLATMGELAASIAHELNNPLATVGLRAEFIQNQLDPDDPKRAALEVISQEVERMATLVANLLQFSRRSHQQISTVDLKEELTSSLDLTHYHLRSHGINVVKDIPPSLPTIQADRQQLRQVFLNLLTNASDAMPNGGTITVRVQPTLLEEIDAVLIEISDTGSGIDEADMAKLWEPFFTTKPEGKGTGLGLPICRRTIEEHRGNISIASRRGEGTTVSILLPATTQSEIPQERRPK